VQESYYRYINDLLRAQPNLLEKEFDFLLDLKGLVDLDIKAEFARRRMEATFFSRCRATVVSLSFALLQLYLNICLQARLNIDRNYPFESAHFVGPLG
jgi:hypothetical protein